MSVIRELTPFFISEVTPSFLSIVFAVQPAIIPTPTTAPIDAVAGKSASKSEKQARKDGLKGQEITASKVGGALVDVGKVAGICCPTCYYSHTNNCSY
jgi:hypothetical protein